MQQTHTTHPPTKSNRYHTERQCRQYCDSNSNDKFDKLTGTHPPTCLCLRSFIRFNGIKQKKQKRRKEEEEINDG